MSALTLVSQAAQHDVSVARANLRPLDNRASAKGKPQQGLAFAIEQQSR